MDKIVLVNATAARSSGALSILNQFIDFIDNNNKYYIFVDPDFFVLKKQKNISYIKIDTSKWFSRIRWDEYGFKRWVKKNEVNVDVIVSLQNTGVKYNEVIPQIIYYHQPIPFSSIKWNFFRKSEFQFFLYKIIYLFFVRRYINCNTKFIVQIPSLKKAFLKKIPISENNIYVLRPDIVLPNYNLIEPLDLDDNIHFIYPATPLTYKNHCLIIEALSLVKRKNPVLFNKIKVHFTFKPSEAKKIYCLIEKYKLSSSIIFDGIIPYDILLSSYRSMSALLFPSFIESFGLPLIEAASTGIPIIVSDLPYSRDVIGEYEGAFFVEYNNALSWADTILQISLTGQKYSPFLPSAKSDWKFFFDLITQ